MARSAPKAELQAIVDAVIANPHGVGVGDIEAALPEAVARRTLQHRLGSLVASGHIVREGDGRWTKYHPGLYRMPVVREEAAIAEAPRRYEHMRFSDAAVDARRYVRQPLTARAPVAYDRGFLDNYRPNQSFFLDERDRSRLASVGASPYAEGPAGAFAEEIRDRLLVDLSWNSSRLEGNAYSLLETQRLVEFGAEAEGRTTPEARMILNHKDAAAFLVAEAAHIGFDRPTIFTLHALLAKDLLDDPQSPGRLRRRPVGIGRSAFHPLEAPQLIEECFATLLDRAEAIEDPFEQALFALAQIPYLQPFDDVNKRVSRLAANIPLIKANLAPLSFIDVPAGVYMEAMLGVYELRRVELLRDVFIHAYECSARRYEIVQQTIGEPDVFRERHGAALHEVVRSVVRGKLDRPTALAHVAACAERRMKPEDRERFRQTAEQELLSLHEYNFVAYRLSLPEFEAWREVWDG